MDNTDQQNQTTTTVTSEVTPIPSVPSVPTVPESVTITPPVIEPVQVTVTPPVTTVQTPTVSAQITPEQTVVTPNPATVTTETVAPVTTVITTPSPISEENKPSEISPGFVPPPSIEAPVITPMGTPSSLPTTESTTTTITEEPLLPTKKKMSPAVLVVILLGFLTIAGGGTFLISRAISTQQAVAPTAPQSEPFAFEGTISATPTIPQPPSGPAYSDGTIECTDPGYYSYQGQCYPAVPDEQGVMYFITQTGN